MHLPGNLREFIHLTNPELPAPGTFPGVGTPQTRARLCFSIGSWAVAGLNMSTVSFGSAIPLLEIYPAAKHPHAQRHIIRMFPAALVAEQNIFYAVEQQYPLEHLSNA